MPITVETYEHGEAWVIKLTGSMSAVDALDLQGKLVPAAAHRPVLTIFDMSGVELMPSLGIGTMMAYTRGVEARGCTVRFAAVQPAVLEMIRRCKLDTVWEIHDTVDAAAGG
ncbi:MAG: STAS domain-containing protein [Planctomycetota bacterium]